MKKLLIGLLFVVSSAYADINVTEGSGKVVRTITEDSKETQYIYVSTVGYVNGTVAATQSGTWNVNNYTTNVPTVTVSGSVSVTGTVAATQSGVWNVNHSTTIYSTSGIPLVCQSTFTNVAASQTDSSIVSAIASTKIRVVSLAMVTGGTATNVTFNSKGGGAGSAISPLFANAANSGAILPQLNLGWFETATAEALTVTTGSGSTTGILLFYCKI